MAADCKPAGETPRKFKSYSAHQFLKGIFMRVSELMAILSKVDQNLEVTITDGYDGVFYSGDYDVVAYTEEDGTTVLDIGIGGCQFCEEVL